MAATAFVADDAGLAQEGEVLADGREATFRAGGQVGHAGFAFREAFHNPQACGVAQRLENLGAQPQRFLLSCFHGVSRSFQHFREY